VSIAAYLIFNLTTVIQVRLKIFCQVADFIFPLSQ